MRPCWEQKVFEAIQAVAHELHLLREDFRLLGQKPNAHLDIEIGLVKDKKTKEENTMTTVQLTNLQTVTITVAPKNRKGKPAPIDGVPVWTVQSGNCTVAPAADGKSALITTPDAVDADPGANTTEILVEADADLGAGFVPIDETIQVVVSAEAATTLGVEVGTPVDKPDAPALRAAALKPAAAKDKESTKKKKA